MLLFKDKDLTPFFPNLDTGKIDLSEFVRTLRGLGAQGMMNFSDFRSEVTGGDESLSWIVDSAGQKYPLYGNDTGQTLSGANIPSESAMGANTESELAIHGGAGNDTYIWGKEMGTTATTFFLQSIDGFRTGPIKESLFFPSNYENVTNTVVYITLFFACQISTCLLQNTCDHMLCAVFESA